MLQSNINLQTTSIFPVSIQPSTPHYVRNLDFNTHTSPSQPQQQQQHQQQVQQQLYHQSSGVYVTTNPQSKFVVSGQQPMVIQSTASTSQPMRTGFIPLTEVVSSGTPGTSNIAIGFQPNAAGIQQQQQQRQAQQPTPSLMQALTGNYNLTLQQMTPGAAGGYQTLGAVNNITPIVSTATQPSHVS